MTPFFLEGRELLYKICPPKWFVSNNELHMILKRRNLEIYIRVFFNYWCHFFKTNLEFRNFKISKLSLKQLKPNFECRIKHIFVQLFKKSNGCRFLHSQGFKWYEDRGTEKSFTGSYFIQKFGPFLKNGVYILLRKHKKISVGSKCSINFRSTKKKRIAASSKKAKNKK